MTDPIEVVTNDPKTLSDTYLAGVRQRLANGTGTLTDRRYADEAQRRLVEKREKRRLIFERYSRSWPRGSLTDALKRFAPDAVGEISGDGVKTVYLDPRTGIEVKYDNENYYFRIRDTKGRGYLDLDGNPISMGTRKREVARDYVRQQTHIIDTDKP